MTIHSTNNYSAKDILYNICYKRPKEMLKFYSEDEGFRGIYTESLDKPFLDNHIFLMYEFEALDSNWFLRNDYFTKNPLYYDSYPLYIKYKLYYVFVFIRPKSVIMEKNTLPLEERIDWLEYKRKNQGLSIEKS